nr:RagB/SusD family nutrient uptake outer membrane protein [Niabella hibiscisoli]
MVNTTFDANKWKRAAEACKEAIDACEAVNIRLHVYPRPPYALSDTTLIQLSLRNAVTDDDWNEELIWGSSVASTNNLQAVTVAHFNLLYGASSAAIADQGATYKTTQFFYTKNGVPINEDNSLDFSNPTTLRTGTAAEGLNNTQNYVSARINFDRENRYYAFLGFDGGIWYMPSSLGDQTTLRVEGRAGGRSTGTPMPLTGLFAKKLINLKFAWLASNGITNQRYPWPIMRLADLYLLYAEALNESEGPVANVFTYLDLIRTRAGLKGIKESWDTYSNNPSKYTTKDGMRTIIRQERTIELCFEGSRFWDVRRWKIAGAELNTNVQGWDVNQSAPELYYRLTTFAAQRFVSPRDYLWPIAESNLLVNDNLVQNPGW